MTLSKSELVDIPNNTYRQKKYNVEYIYLYIEFYKTETGKSRNKSKCIGKLDAESGKMIPNKTYYDYYNKNKNSNSENDYYGNVLSIGYSAVVEECFKELHLKDIIIDVFGEELYKRIKIISSYIVKEGCVPSYIDDFCLKTLFIDTDEVITSQKISLIFEEISEYEEFDFYRKWISEIDKSGYICYDVTSISTYSRMIEEAEYGYNRDHEKLPQFNLGLFTSEKTSYPVYMSIYNGSINDKTELFYAIKNAKYLGIKKIKVVLDGGFFDEERIKILHKEEFIFTIGMPMYLNLSKELIDNYGLDIYSPEYLTKYPGVYGKIVKKINI